MEALITFWELWLMHVHGGFECTRGEADRIARMCGMWGAPMALAIGKA